MWADTAVITPKGKKTTAKEWARSLDLFYAPSIVFFDIEGTEIIRVDSVTHFYRLWGVLDYVNKQGYKQTTDYQKWRLQQREISK
jgi:thioredoxin-related protein